MTTDVQLWRDGDWVDVRYSDFEITVATSQVATAPSAQVTMQARESVSANQDFRIVIDGTTRFEGYTESSGRKRGRGQLEVSAVHPAESLFEDEISLTLEGSVSAVDVLEAALSNADRGSQFELEWVDSDVSLADDYDVDNRPVADVFRDMTDRTGRLWWIDPAGSTIHVEPVGYRGTWQSLDANADGIAVNSFDEGSVKTVKNDVTVVATRGEGVEGSASDSSSISEYGRRSETVNVSYAVSETEANAYAEELIVTDPLAEGDIDVPARVGDVTQPLVNYTVGVTDASKDIDADGLVIEQQQIEQGRAGLAVGEGQAASLENAQRRSKSRDDETEPGAVMGEDRIADDSIAESKLQDLAVSIDKIQDEAVDEAQIRQDAISETKVQDDSISTPKLQVGSVDAGVIDSAAVDTIHLAADAVDADKIQASAVGADEIAAGAITADKIDALELDTGQLEIGADTSGRLAFEVDSDTNSVQITPQNPDGSYFDMGAAIGDFGARMGRIHTAQIFGVEDMSVDGILETEGFDTETMELNTDSSDPIVSNSTVNGTALQPQSDNTCQIGTGSSAFSSIDAHNYFEQSPEPLSTEAIDLDRLHELSWYNPPEYCAQCKASDGDDREYRYWNPDDGLELGHVTNYVFEVCKAQQSVIEDQQAELDEQADRISALEDRLDALESDGGKD